MTNLIKLTKFRSKFAKIANFVISFFVLTFLTFLTVSSSNGQSGQSGHVIFLHGDIDVFGDIANIASLASAFLSPKGTSRIRVPTNVNVIYSLYIP